MMKRLFSTMLGFGILALMSVPLTARAQVDVLSPACQIDRNSTACISNQNQPSSGNSIYGRNGVLTKAASLFAVIVGIASVIMIIIGGFKYVTSSGDPSSVKSAKDTVLFAIVGMLVALAAQSIVVFVLRGIQ